jgi:hypothetical protein
VSFVLSPNKTENPWLNRINFPGEQLSLHELHVNGQVIFCLMEFVFGIGLINDLENIWDMMRGLISKNRFVMPQKKPL